MDIAIFSASSLFSEEDDIHTREEDTETQEIYVERNHQFPGMELIIREFSFHQLNANLLWPGTFAFAEWLVQHRSCIEGRRTIELGSGTGALAIFLRKSYSLDITTSDYDDQEIEDNIAHNCNANDLPVIPHVKHTWGDKFPNSDPDWDLIIASDILLYVKQYANLIQTISFLLKSYKPSRDRTTVSLTVNDENNGDVLLPWPAFLMNWRRRIGKEDESIFFDGCEKAGLEVKHIGSRVYCIAPYGNEKSKQHLMKQDAVTQESYVERKHQFPGMEFIIREFSFRQLNANLLWPGTFAFAEWLVQHRSCIDGRRTIELGSGTGALAIFLRKSYNLDITTSDYDDQEIEDNIAHNCSTNDLPVIPHVKHTWGDKFPNSDPDWDLIVASDILLYVKQYANLIQTISFLLKSYKPCRNRTTVSPTMTDENNGDVVLPWPAFLMSWRRRIRKEDESIFFDGCEKAGLEVKHIGSRVYCITPYGNEK